MSIVRNKRLWATMLVLAGGTLFQVLPSSCTNYAVAQALTSFNFCSVFNCEGGTFFDPCNPVALLVDCPTTTPTTTR
jgi:hypothetical protein